MPTPASVDEYLAALTDEQRTALEGLRATIRAAAPDATETISYQIPTLRDHGRMLVSYAAFRDHCSLFPASARVVDALGDALAPYLSGRATIRFRTGEPLPVELVTRVVKARLEENAEIRRQKTATRRPAT